MYKIHKYSMIVVSLIYNIIYWCFNWNKWETTVNVVEETGKKIKTVEDVTRFMGSFRWRNDGLLDWQPWVETAFARDFVDDCDGAAVLGKWALGNAGIDSKIVRLWKTGNRYGHTVCISNDHRIVISNNDVSEISPEDYPDAVYAYFNNDFNIMA